MKKILLIITIVIIYYTTIQPYAYLPDNMSISNALIAIAHNSPQSKAYGWRYYQQLGTLRSQWNAGARGGKINLHWYAPIDPTKQFFAAANPKVWEQEEAAKMKVLQAEVRLGIKKPEDIPGYKEQINKIINIFKLQKKPDTAIELARKSLMGEENLPESVKKALEPNLKKLKAQYAIAQKNLEKEKEKLPKTEPFIGLCHDSDGSSNCKQSATLLKKGKIDNAEVYFREFAQLLKENPKDIIIIILENYLEERSEFNAAKKYTTEQTLEKLNQIIKNSGLGAYAYKLDSNYYGKTGSQMWPTLGELRKNNKRAIIFIDESKYSSSPYLNKQSDNPYRRTAWQFDWKTDLGKTCKMRDNDPNSKMFLVDHGPEATIPKGSKKGNLFDFIKKLGINPKIEGAALESTDYKYLNSEPVIRQRLQDCSNASPGTPPSILNIDMIEVGDVGNTVKKINMERIQKYIPKT